MSGGNPNHDERGRFSHRDLRFEKLANGIERTGIKVHYGYENGGALQGRASTENISMMIHPAGHWKLSYELEGLKTQTKSGQSEDIESAKRDALHAIPEFTKSLSIAHPSSGKRKAISFGAAEGGTIGKIES